MNEKVALITGGARRIGAAIVKYLHHQGYRVIIHYRHSHKDATHLANTLNSIRPDSAITFPFDFADGSGLDTFVHQVTQAYGRLDALIHNASAFYKTPLGSITASDWQTLGLSNALMPLLLSQQLAPTLRVHRGSIVTLVDIHAQRPLKGYLTYCMAKSALSMMTLGLAAELAPDIRVNGVAPGPILWPEHTLDTEQKQQVLASVPLHRLGYPQEIAQAIGFLLAAEFITGEILCVDGGRNIRSLEEA